MVFTMLVVALLIAMWATISVLAPYSAEVYPMRIRARGAGIAAGASKPAACSPWASPSSHSRRRRSPARPARGATRSGRGDPVDLLWDRDPRRRLEEIRARTLECPAAAET